MGVVAQPVTPPTGKAYGAPRAVRPRTYRAPLIYRLASMTAESTGHRSSETLMVRAVPSGTPR